MKKLIPIFVAILSQNTMAGGLEIEEIQPSKWSVVFAISGGAAWPTGAKAQTLLLAPEIEKTYTVESVESTAVDSEFFGGLQYAWSDRWQGQLGFSVVTLSNIKIEGDIWDDADPLFNNYSYTYQVRHNHIALKGKLLGDFDYRLIPWISASLGIGWNFAHNFNNMPTIPEAVSSPNFEDRTQTALSYTFGAGVQYTLNQNFQIGIGYEFVGWGKSRLGLALGQTIDNKLGPSHLYTNGVMVNLTFLSA